MPVSFSFPSFTCASQVCFSSKDAAWHDMPMSRALAFSVFSTLSSSLFSLPGLVKAYEQLAYPQTTRYPKKQQLQPFDSQRGPSKLRVHQTNRLFKSIWNQKPILSEPLFALWAETSKCNRLLSTLYSGHHFQTINDHKKTTYELNTISKM